MSVVAGRREWEARTTRTVHDGNQTKTELENLDLNSTSRERGFLGPAGKNGIRVALATQLVPHRTCHDPESMPSERG